MNTFNSKTISYENFIIEAKNGPTPKSDGLGWRYFKEMKRHKDKIAQIIADTGELDTFENLLTRCIRAAIKLQSKNLPQDTFISVCSVNHRDSVVLFVAAKFINLNFAAVDPSLSVDDTVYLLDQATPKVIFVSPDSIELVEASIAKLGKEIEIVVFGQSEKYDIFDSYLEASSKEKEFVPIKPRSCKDTAVIFFSSGTTGLPKGICLNHYALEAQAENIIRLQAFQEVSLSYTTFYWISAQIVLTTCTIAGFARVVTSKFDPEQFWKLVDKYKIGSLFISPFQFTEIFRVGKPKEITAESLKAVLFGGGPTCEEHILKARLAVPHAVMCQGYGQTEASGCTTGFNIASQESLKLLQKKPTSCGQPLPGFTYKVVDVETEKVVGPGKEGELRLRSEYLMNGYHNRDITEAFDADGWLRTGDIVYYDEDFCFYVVDRIKEMLKYQGWHVPPAVVESVLQQHPAVENGVVIGIPHEVDGDHPMGLVILKSGYQGRVTSEEIENFVNSRVPERQKLRAGVKVINEVPLTPTGKIKRKELRKIILSRS